jgi:hypothetical protein
MSVPFPSSVFLAGGLVGSAYLLAQVVRIAIASRWPTVEGEITGAYLIQRGFDARGLSERVTYRYTVGGKEFLNDRVRFGPQPQRSSIVPASGHPPATTAIAEQYPVGRRVLVRYNPRRPQESLLHAQPNFAVFVILAATAVCLFVGVRGLLLRPTLPP